MKALFDDIYNKIMDLFRIERSENTRDCAANRLQVILMHDRTKLDPLIMNKMREELINVFSKYVVIDKEELEIGLKNEGDAVALMLNIPIVRAKTEQELEDIRKKLQEDEIKISEETDSNQDERETENKEINPNEDVIEGEVTEVIIEEIPPQEETKEVEVNPVPESKNTEE